MSEIIERYMGTGYNKEAKLFKYRHSNGETRWTFRDRLGRPANPTDDEAAQIIKRWGLIKID